jgi:hypothetical protein
MGFQTRIMTIYVFYKTNLILLLLTADDDFVVTAETCRIK